MKSEPLWPHFDFLTNDDHGYVFKLSGSSDKSFVLTLGREKKTN